MENNKYTHPKSIKQDRDIKYRLEEKKAQRKFDRNKIIEKNRKLENDKKCEDQLNGTYIVPEYEKGSNRRKLLDLWRKEREQKLLDDKQKQKPVFKVYHVENKRQYSSMTNLKAPCLCQTLSASRVNLTANTTTNSTLSTTRSGPLTRSLSRKINQTVESVKTNIKTFAEQAKSASKFTFQALLVKKTKKPIETPAVEFKVPQAPIQTQQKKNINKKNDTTKLSEDILICSTNQISSSSNTMQYEDFCDELFVKNDDVDHEFTYEAAKMDTNITNELTKSAKKRLKGNRSSYRKSRSGMYKIDIQSSILELDDCEHHNNFEKNENKIEKLETIIDENIVENVKINEPIIKLPIIHDEENLNKKVVDIEEEKNNVIVKDDKANSDDDFYELNGEKRNVTFYRELVKLETKMLNDLSAKWDLCINEAPEDVQGDIRSAIGLAKLLIDERFTQFIELVDQSEFKTGDKVVKCSDLQGFWDMVDFQIIDVKKKFDVLEKLKANNYVFEASKPVKKTTNKVAPKEKKSTTVTAGNKKSKFAEFKAQMLKNKQQSCDDNLLENQNNEELEKENNIIKIKTPLKLDNQQKLNTPLKISNEPLKIMTPLRPIEANSIQLKSIDKKLVFSYSTNSDKRQNDFIKFDTPKGQLKNNYQKTPLTKIHNEEEEDDDDDFLNINSFKPISWRNSVANTNDIIIDLTSNLNTININLIGTPTPKTPKTPKNRKSIFQPTNGELAKSPLLKLAYISSHGKRLSKSGQI